MPDEIASSAVVTLLSLKLQILRKGGHDLGEDLYQELWVKFLRERPRPNWSCGQILRIATNLRIDILRQKTRRSPPMPKECGDLQRSGRDPCEELERHEQRAHVRSEWNKLRPKLREVLEAQFDLDETDQQTADRLRVSIETVRTRKKRAKKQLRNLLSLLDSTSERPRRHCRAEHADRPDKSAQV